MSQSVTLGGDRLGSGKKQTFELHNYHMSSFNQEQDFKSSMAPGILYPFLKLIGTNHGTFDIDLDSFIRTLPTKGPLFGSYKFQADIFLCPIRLYQGILHNNPVDIGLKMNQVYLPKILVPGQNVDPETGHIAMPIGSNIYNYQVNESSLMKYFGLSGVGTSTSPLKRRKINAIPFLAYYDIFKNYYSNKQEENAYVICPNEVQQGSTKLSAVLVDPNNGTTEGYVYQSLSSDIICRPSNGFGSTFEITFLYKVPFDPSFKISDEVKESILNTQKLTISIVGNHSETHVLSDWKESFENSFSFSWKLNDNSKSNPDDLSYTIQLDIVITNDETILVESESEMISSLTFIQDDVNFSYYNSGINLQSFPLKNIDEMRRRLLSYNDLGDEFVIDQNTDLLPYSVLVNVTSSGIPWNAFIDNGLLVKTYQSDLFNNWLNSETIDTISQLSAVEVTNGTFTMDTLNFAEKVYEVLNRIGVSGGTYADWQEAVYGAGALRMAETPMYMGGMSSEIMFEEVISSSETQLEDGQGYQPLGSLGGKGTQVGKHGGNNIHIKCEEPCYVIGICSITPRIAYSQGNDWDLTDLDSLDDLHKPGLDGIGFQDLMVEQMAWWNTKLADDNIIRSAAGKQTAWINYQTAVDKVYGDFAKQDGIAFMVLNRNYERLSATNAETLNSVGDLTTYIDPSKWNYVFAEADLAAQNFWVQIHSKVVSRRKMAAQQIPNL